MKQGFISGLGSTRHLGLAAGAAIVVMLAASQVGLGVSNGSTSLAAEMPAVRYVSPALQRVPVARPASLPVDVVLWHVRLAPEAILPRVTIALPISFGRPVAPEDDAPAPPPRWRHHHRTARHFMHHFAGNSVDGEAAPTDS